MSRPGADPSDRLAALLDARPSLLPWGARVLVAWSGGPDSTALLHLLLGLRRARDLRITAAHFDHGLGPGSADVATRCARRAAELGVPLAVGRPERPVAPTQDALRVARYAFLRAVAEEEGAARVATGHQADDQAETVLFRLIRGTGLRGLGGIPARRGRLVRPLLPFRAAELAAWLDREAIPYERDPANSDLRWARVRIRAAVLPALATDGTDPVPALVGLARRAAACDVALDAAATRLLARAELGRTAEGTVRLDRHALLAAPPGLRARLLRVRARAEGARLTRGGTRAGVEFMSRGRSGSWVDLGHGYRLVRAFDEIRLAPPGARDAVPDGRRSDATGHGLEISTDRGDATIGIGDRAVRVRWRAHAGGTPGESEVRPGRVALPVGREHYPLWLRSWKPGDRMRTTAGTRKLKKLFAEFRVPRDERDRRLVLADRSGRILWVEEVAAARAALATGAGETLVIEFENA